MVNRRSFLGKIAGMVLSATLISDIEALGVVSKWSGEPWSGVALPLVRKLYPSLAADIVSVQPMNVPSNMVFFLDFKYGEQAS